MNKTLLMWLLFIVLVIMLYVDDVIAITLLYIIILIEMSIKVHKHKET